MCSHLIIRFPVYESEKINDVGYMEEQLFFTMGLQAPQHQLNRKAETNQPPLFSCQFVLADPVQLESNPKSVFFFK